MQLPHATNVMDYQLTRTILIIDAIFISLQNSTITDLKYILDVIVTKNLITDIKTATIDGRNTFFSTE
jgi:hypothetical protein